MEARDSHGTTNGKAWRAEAGDGRPVGGSGEAAGDPGRAEPCRGAERGEDRRDRRTVGAGARSGEPAARARAGQGEQRCSRSGRDAGRRARSIPDRAVGQHPREAPGGDLQTGAGAAGRNPETRRRRAAPGGAHRPQSPTPADAAPGAEPDLRPWVLGLQLRLSAAAECAPGRGKGEGAHRRGLWLDGRGGR